MRPLFLILMVLAITLSVTTLPAQDLSFTLGVGSGTYGMKELKELNKVFQEAVPFETRLVSDFPPYLNYSASLRVRDNNAFYGIFYSFQTTGSRISARDYSGEYLLDMIRTGNALGVSAGFIIPSEGRLDYSFSAVYGVILTRLKLSENFSITGTEIVNTRFRASVQNPFAGPVFAVSCPVRNFDFGLSTGYLFQITGGRLTGSGDYAGILTNPSTGRDVGAGWSGFRAELTAGVRFGKKENRNYPVSSSVPGQ